MNIADINATRSVQAPSSVTAASHAPPASGAKPLRLSSHDSAAVSGPGAMMSKLKSLQESDPAKFKQTMTEISTKLTEAASSSTDPKEKQALTDLAAKFQAAGDSGDLSALAPKKTERAHAPPKGRGELEGRSPSNANGPPRGGRPSGPPPPKAGAIAGGAAAGSASKQADPADTNSDGKVSDAERLAYEESQAAASPSSVSGEAYGKALDADAHDAMNAVMSKAAAIVDGALA